MNKTVKTPTTGLDESRKLLAKLGLEHIGDELPQLMERATREDLGLLEFFNLALKREWEQKEERRIRTSLKLSGIPNGYTLEGFDFLFQRGLDKKRIELLGTCEFAKRHENVLFLGPPGVGKSHLASALGVKAIQNGFSTLFISADALLERLRKHEMASEMGRRTGKRKYMGVSVLIIDELGFQVLERKDAHLLFRVISYRYEKSSTIITSNKSIREWPEMLAGDEVLATAILDRLLHRCHVIQIDGHSFRLKEIERKLTESITH
jgi:DNA replication protein DnaC